MVAYQYIYVMKNLSKTYPGGKRVLNNIWLSFFPGAKIGVLGPNGAGKSTPKRGRRRGLPSAICRRNRSLTRTKTLSKILWTAAARYAII